MSIAIRLFIVAVLSVLAVSAAAETRSGLRIAAIDDGSGWGSILAEHIDADVVNVAFTGTSSDFLEGGEIEKLLEIKPDFAFIQLGRADSAVRGHRVKVDAEDYRRNLGRMIDALGDGGVEVIIVTPTAGRSFAADGKLLPDMLAPYVFESAKLQLRNRTKNAFLMVDFFSYSREIFGKIGPQAVLEQFGAEATDGSSHLTPRGAAIAAGFICSELARADDKYAPLADAVISKAQSAEDFPAQADRRISAFPGAEGFGRYARGGRGGVVYEVTNLNNSGPGSLRAAVDAKGPRTVVFKVSGTITLLNKINVMHPYLTIAGQTAPGDGICIKGADLFVRTHDVIVRFMRFRGGGGENSLHVMYKSRDVIIDHCSISWGGDEVASFYGNENVTVQWCMIGEGFFGHSCGGLWGPASSYHHNLIYSSGTRNPKFAYADGAVTDFRNNVVYNWGYQSSITGRGDLVNIVNNYYKHGPGKRPNDKLNRTIVTGNDVGGRTYVSGNYVWGYPDVTADNWNGGVQGVTTRVDKPLPAPPVTLHTAEEAYELVLAKAGASLPRRDPVDERVIHELKTHTYSFYGIKRGEIYPGLMHSPMQAGGWPQLNTYDVPVDTDGDGMPDWWEIARGLNLHNPANRNGYDLCEDYTNLEVYLDYLVKAGKP